MSNSGPRATLLVLLLLGSIAFAQNDQRQPPDLKLDRDYVRRVVADAIKTIADNFAFPEQRAGVVQTMTRKLNAGDYDGISSALALVPQINRDLQAAAHDAHLRFGYSYEPQPTNVDENSPAEVEKDRAAAYDIGFGLQAVERLPGDIGYLRIDNFVSPDFAAEQVGMAFKILAGTRALIVDLRENRGGDVDAVPMFVSYFVPPHPVLLSEFFSGPDNHTRQAWSLSYVSGPRYLGRPVFVLTSAKTFSAAEGVAFQLKRFGATIVGERTRGGAHPTRWYNIDPHFAVSVPVLRPLGPTWEGTGITPDIAVPANAAFDEAKTRALAKVKEKPPQG